MQEYNRSWPLLVYYNILQWWKKIHNASGTDGAVFRHSSVFCAIMRLELIKDNIQIFRRFREYSRTSMARTPLGP